MSCVKDFSDWLIASDIDGTLNNKMRRTPEVNIKAVDRFVHTLGGNFTLASARCTQSLEPHYKRLPDLKVPAIVLNGAGIYDFKCEKMIWFNPMSKTAEEIVEKSLDKFPFLEIAIFTDEEIYLVKPVIMAPIMMVLDTLTHKRCRSLSEVPRGNWGKVIFFCLPFFKSKVMEFVNSLVDIKLSVIATTAVSFDLVASDTNKGNALFKLAEMLGIPYQNTGAIGDYYNDVDMLRTVGHAACCHQAPKELHELSEFHACHCNDGAVADFLSYIEKNY